MEELDQLEPEISEYFNFLSETDIEGYSVIKPEIIDKNFDKLGKALNTLLVYPDIFIDIITPEDNSFKLDFDQRISLRSFSRHRQTYFVGTRGISKSFQAFLSRYLTAMSLPNHHTFVCADVKTQAADIAKQTVMDDLWVKFPFLQNEMIKVRTTPGVAPKAPYTSGKDSVRFNFTGGGAFDVVGIDSARGKRRQSGLIEEVIEQDATKINEKIIPLMNIARKNLRGKLLPNEPHAAKIWITTAGYHNTFAHMKLLETLCYTAVDPDRYMALSMTYKIPVKMGRLDQRIIMENLMSPTYTQDSFDREYNSIWSSNLSGAAFNIKAITRARKIKRAERIARADDPNEFYIISADMAKDGQANTAVVVLKVRPRSYNFIYQQVNAFKIDTTDYKIVADRLKETVADYDARLLIYDANGIGAALRDWINRDSISIEGQLLPGLGIINPPKEAEKDIIVHRHREICYEIKATGELNGKINKLFFGRLSSGAIKMLVSKAEILDSIKNNEKFMRRSMNKKKRFLEPYDYADIIEEELLNLDVVEINDVGSPTLKVARRNKAIQKDFYSAFSYGVYGTHLLFETKHYNVKKKNDWSKAIKFTSSKRG